MTKLEIWKFMSNVGLAGTHAKSYKSSGGLHASVWHVDKGGNSFAAKEYTTSITSNLFPNLPDKEAEVLRRVYSKMSGLFGGYQRWSGATARCSFGRRIIFLLYAIFRSFDHDL